MASIGWPFFCVTILTIFGLGAALPNQGATVTNKQLKNVLFIAVDDLRPELGTYGQNFIKSQNINALAAKSIVFECALLPSSYQLALHPAPLY